MKKIITFILILVICFSFAGCGKKENPLQSSSGSINTGTKLRSDVEVNNDVTVNETASDSQPGRFFMLGQQEIYDGSLNSITVTILVDRRTNVMYMMSQKYREVGLTVMLDQDGNPLLYEEGVQYTK